MRIERWYWIVVFCVISLFAHFSLKYVRASLVPSGHITPASTNLEVTLAPPDPGCARAQSGRGQACGTDAQSGNAGTEAGRNGHGADAFRRTRYQLS